MADQHARSTRGRRWVPIAVVATALLSLAVPAYAAAAGDGAPLRGGVRNPSGGKTQELAHETQIIANTPANSYGTRQSNKGLGGGAIYGCRSALGASPFDPVSSTPCIRANNLSGGEAFQFTNAGGPVIGILQAGSGFAPNPKVAPFFTNATGVATGLNADMVDGLNAQDVIDQAKAAVAATPTGAYAQVLGAASGSQTIVNERSSGITDADVSHPDTGVYCVKGMAKAPKNATATLDSVPGEVSVNLAGNDAKCPAGTQASVRTYDSAGTLADAGFYLNATF